MIQLDIVIPLYNPAADWGRKLAFHFDALRGKLGDIELKLLIVNDGSPDEEIVASGFRDVMNAGVDARLISYSPNKGKGHALRSGLAQSQAAYTIYTDLDFPYDTESMVNIIKVVSQGQADIVLGYREDDYYTNVPPFRKALSETFRFVLRSVLRFPVTDTQCGLKGMNRRGREIFLRTKINRFLIDMEFIKLASRDKHVAIQPVVVQLRKDVKFSTMGPGILLRELVNLMRILLT